MNLCPPIIGFYKYMETLTSLFEYEAENECPELHRRLMAHLEALNQLGVHELIQAADPGGEPSTEDEVQGGRLKVA